LSLLTLTQAALYLLHWAKKIPDPCIPDVFQQVMDDDSLTKEFWRLRLFLSNAVDAGVLPSLKKPIPKPDEKRIFEQVDVPAEMRDFIPKSYDCWVTWEDLITFTERSPVISDKAYAHSREALAKMAWMLANKAGVIGDGQNLAAALDTLVIDFTEQGIELKLGEVTLKGCAREILAAGEEIQAKN